MGRPPRIQFEGATYHVANRGRADNLVLGTAAAAQVFVNLLLEACSVHGWRLHAFALLPNEYHLALTTPRGNLAEGMHWLQRLASTRVGADGGPRGPVFAGRYRSRLLEPGPELARWVAEVHLVPVRAGLVALPQLDAFRWSSYRLYLRGERRDVLDPRPWLPCWPGLGDTPEGWRRYRDRLEGLLVADDHAQLGLGGPVGGRRGKARPRPREGTAAARAAAAAVYGRELAELREPRWIEALDRLLAAAGRSGPEALAAPKSAAWKVEVAAAMRRETTATNGWLARALNMGTARTVSVYLGRRKRVAMTSGGPRGGSVTGA